jgi:hypothetical protein
MDSRNRPDSKKATNDWLTPRPLVSAAGPFKLDPCAYPAMPWRTAETMVSNARPRKNARGIHVDIVADGLELNWHRFGRKFINPPWDDPLPWAKKMADAGNGVFLSTAKSTDTRWAQVILESADAILFFKGRLLYCYPNGVQSTGGWTPSMLAAYGEENVRALERVRRLYPGIVMTRTLEQRVFSALEAEAAAIMDDAKRLAPIDTGALRASLNVTADQGETV